MDFRNSHILKKLKRSNIRASTSGSLRFCSKSSSTREDIEANTLYGIYKYELTVLWLFRTLASFECTETSRAGNPFSIFGKTILQRIFLQEKREPLSMYQLPMKYLAFSPTPLTRRYTSLRDAIGGHLFRCPSVPGMGRLGHLKHKGQYSLRANKRNSSKQQVSPPSLIFESLNTLTLGVCLNDQNFSWVFLNCGLLLGVFHMVRRSKAFPPTFYLYLRSTLDRAARCCQSLLFSSCF